MTTALVLGRDTWCDGRPLCFMLMRGSWYVRHYRPWYMEPSKTHNGAYGAPNQVKVWMVNSVMGRPVEHKMADQGSVYNNRPLFSDYWTNHIYSNLCLSVKRGFVRSVQNIPNTWTFNIWLVFCFATACLSPAKIEDIRSNRRSRHCLGCKFTY